MGLVGGNQISDQEKIKRKKMSVDEVIQFYHEVSAKIFGKKNMTKISRAFRWLPCLMRTYHKTGLEDALEEKFGDCKLEDIFNISGGCNVGVVATKMIKAGDKKQNEEGDKLEKKGGRIFRKSKSGYIVEPVRKNRFCLFSTQELTQLVQKWSVHFCSIFVNWLH